ncbi:MAG: serine/threonine protein kinase, partial [Deltaproteobacteria bacterium]|nr:serine/threonine protein kinase [Nannocystaceae bacterium]
MITDIDEPAAAQDPVGACPDDAALVELLVGRAGALGRRMLHAHVDGCARCRELLAHLARFNSGMPERGIEDAATLASTRTPSRAPGAIIGGTRIGHFEIVEEIGRGGMGTVYAALDTRLARRVAIKLVHASAPGTDDAEPSQRLLREAQAMAAITHPNVVTVYEAGTFGAEVFLAMELVDGDTLAQWLSLARRPWPAIVRVFVEAGRGLAAAHRAGLVHRDFKPTNVLVATDGRVRVTDFGLVQAGMSEAEAARTWVHGDASTRSGTGMLVGTPRYMAPEQLRGDTVDARSDQFAFCVALFEALWLRHPFGDGPRERVDAVREGA